MLEVRDLRKVSSLFCLLLIRENAFKVKKEMSEGEPAILKSTI